jgi:hypothetical protein
MKTASTEEEACAGVVMLIVTMFFATGDGWGLLVIVVSQQSEPISALCFSVLQHGIAWQLNADATAAAAGTNAARTRMMASERFIELHQG